MSGMRVAGAVSELNNQRRLWAVPAQIRRLVDHPSLGLSGIANSYPCAVFTRKPTSEKALRAGSHFRLTRRAASLTDLALYAALANSA